MSDNTNNPEGMLGMPVVEVIAYLTEVASMNQMISDRIVAQLEVLRAALVDAEAAQSLADQSTQDDG